MDVIRIFILFVSMTMATSTALVCGGPGELSAEESAQHHESIIDLRSGQNSEPGYFFALTRYVMGTSLPTYTKPFLFVFSFGLDIGMLPFALVGEVINQANEVS